MDNEALIDSWIMFSREHDNLSVDRLLCKPEERNAFVKSVSNVCGSNDEEEILWALVGARKNKHLREKMKKSSV